MTRITPDHLARGAFVYVRQSTNDQVLNNHESRRRQYGLADRARALGWADVEVIDDDLGRSGSGIARPGFEKLLAAICEGRVGAVVSIEASRLARNGRDWHTLLEFCGLVGTLIVDEDGVYDPRHPNDRLLLGMKGTMSEMELSLFRQRSLEALKQKARRGELFLTVAIGYVKTAHDRIEKDPDRRVQEAIALVFAKFAELQTVRQVHLWMRQQRMPLPAIEYGPDGRKVVWKLPVYNTVHHMLTNPIYAGAYAFGRTGSRITIEAGRKRIVRGFRKDRSAWEVLIRDHHEGYIGWAEFERNQRLITDNANGKSFMSRGSIRRGEALLAGLLRCGHCGRKLHVAYSGENGSSGRYHCRGGQFNHGGDRCISFGGMRIDRAVGAEVIERLQPLGIEAAIGAMEARRAENAEKQRQIELALEQARYEAARARRQYDAVDPENRLVAGRAGASLERAPARRARARGRARCIGGEPANHADRGRARTAACARRRCRARLAQRRRDAGDPQTDHPHADRGDRGAGRGRCARPGDPMGRRRSHAAARAQEPRWPASLGHAMPMWSNSSPCLPASCRTRPSRRSSIVPARRPAGVTAGPVRASACCAITARSRPIATVSAPSGAKSRWTKRPSALKVSEATVRRLIAEKFCQPPSTAKVRHG